MQLFVIFCKEFDLQLWDFMIDRKNFYMWIEFAENVNAWISLVSFMFRSFFFENS